MKHTEETKEKNVIAKTEEEVKSGLEDIKGEAEEGLILDEEDLDKVAGGYIVRFERPVV